MAEIRRSKGITKSERYLAQLADRTFLNLWEYPNVYRDVIVNGHRVGKELCDLLVICGDHVIIFSVKTVDWPKKEDVNVAWSRWYKRAVKKSGNQVRGAERWISQDHTRIFLDSACSRELPIKIPPRESRRVHGIVVALGAHEACSKFFSGDSGSFLIIPSILDGAHIDSSSDKYTPFAIGDIESKGSFIHVMNDISLDIIMRELDTITDFTEYLEQKSSLVRSGNLVFAAGEEELLAYYLTHMTEEDKHGFIHPDGRPLISTDKISIESGHFRQLITNPYYIRKKEADKNSYVWDDLINKFAYHILKGTIVVPNGGAFEISDHEIGVRQMALEPRLVRRMLSDDILDIMTIANQRHRVCRAMTPYPETSGKGIGYIFMTLPHPEQTLNLSYAQYRQVRINILYAYCMGVFKNNRHLKLIVGIATEPPPSSNGLFRSSEDIITIESPSEWTSELEEEVEELCKSYDILNENTIRFHHLEVTEYPDDA